MLITKPDLGVFGVFGAGESVIDTFDATVKLRVVLKLSEEDLTDKRSDLADIGVLLLGDDVELYGFAEKSPSSDFSR